MGIDNIPPEMLACQVVEYNAPYKIHQIPTPDPQSLGPNHLLVKIAVASLCHTDRMVSSGTFSSRLPQTASHEGTGVVVAVGSSMNDFKVGDRVMCGLPVDRCRKCSSCRGPEDERQYCNQIKGYLGVTLDGCFAEYVVADGNESVKVPDRVSFETAAPLACAGCTVYRGVLQAKVAAGGWLGIVGSGGGLGHLGIQFSKAKGIKVVGIDARDEGIALSKEMGADVVVDARKDKEDVVKQVMHATGGEGCSATINLSDAKSAAALACAITKMHGKMVQIAQPDEVAVPMTELIFRDVKIEGSLICSRQQAQDMLNVVAEKGITVKTNIFRGLRKIPELIEYAHGGKMQGKGVVIVDDDAVRESKQGGGAVP